MTVKIGEEKYLQAIRRGHELSRVKDIDILLEKILHEARKLTSADAGSIYLREGDYLKFSHTQNDTLRKKLPEGKKLIYSTFKIPINDESIAGYVALTGKSLTVEDVYNIQGCPPYRFDSRYDEVSNYRTGSMLTVPLKIHTGKVVGVLQLINATDASGRVVPFIEDDIPLVDHFADMAASAIEKAVMTRELILRMIKMAELRDPKETGAHVNRVAAYSVEIYEEWARVKGFDANRIHRDRDLLRMAAMLHDVGKIGVSDVILKKPGKLTEEEFEAMKAHTYLGAALFQDKYSEFDEAAAVVALMHHERWDGGGYPGYVDVSTGMPVAGKGGLDRRAVGRKAEEIHPFGRVVAIADVFDALSSRRVYKEPWNEDAVFEEMRRQAGKHFDPEMIEVFFSVIDVIKVIQKRYPEEGEDR